MADFEDSSAGHSEVHTPTIVGAIIDAATYKYGGGSGFFEHNNHSVSYPDSADWNLGNSNFTVSCWVRMGTLVNTATGYYLGGQYADDNNRWQIYICGLSTDYAYIGFRAYNGGVCKGWVVGVFATAYEVDRWYHIEVCRNGANLVMFRDGIVADAYDVITAMGTISDITASMYISRPGYGLADGNIDVLKIDNGICRHTSNFIPPADEDVDNDAYTVLLLKMNPASANNYTLSLQEYMDFLLNYSWKDGVRLSDLSVLIDHYTSFMAGRLSILSNLGLTDWSSVDWRGLLNITSDIPLHDLITRHWDANKTISDSIPLSEVLSGLLSHIKILFEQLSLSDTRSFFDKKPITEHMNFSDVVVVVRGLYTSLQDLQTFTDHLIKGIGEGINDPLSLSDGLTYLSRFRKRLSAFVELHDWTNLGNAILRNFAELLSLSDIKESLDKKRNYDNIYFTDIKITFLERVLNLLDIHPLADHVTKGFFQRFSELFEFHEMRFSVNTVIRGILESLSLTDIRNKLYKKNESEVGSLVDIVTKGIGGVRYEPLPLSDLFSNLFGVIRNLYDSFTINDSVTRQWTAVRSLDDTEDLIASPTGNPFFNIGKNEFDNEYFTELNIRNTNKGISSLLSLLDISSRSILQNIFEVSSLSDVKLFFTRKPVDEYLNLNDAYILIRGKYLTLSDLSALVDNIVNGIFKTDQEQLDFIENHGTYIVKSSFDNFNLQDVFDTLKQYYRSFADNNTLVDAVRKLFSISLNDIGLLADYREKYIRPRFSDIFNLADMVLLYMNNAYHFYMFNKFSLNDSNTKKIVLYKSDDISLIATLTKDGYIAIQDAISFTDRISKKIMKVFGEIIPLVDNIEALFETEPFYFDYGKVEPNFVVEDLRVYGGAEMHFYPEQAVDVRWKIRRFVNDVLFDPTSHEVTIYDPKNIVRVVYNSANLAKDSVGVYKYTFNIPVDVVEGDWYAKIKATNGNWSSVLHVHIDVRKL